MKKYLLPLLSAIFVFAALVAAEAQIKKYDIKSGIVTYESILKMGSFDIKKKIIVYFDDYGMKECRETYSNNKLEESYFSDGKNLYSVKHNEKSAHKQGTAYRGTELRVEWSEFGTEKERRSGKYKKLPSMKVAGKNCEMFEYNNGKGSVTQYGGWNRILLYMNLKTKSMENVQRAVMVDENAKVSQEKFKAPAGFKMQ